MEEPLVLAREWKHRLARLIRSASEELVISSPYVSRTGTQFVADNVCGAFKSRGRLTFLTNLSPVNICQGATDPNALQTMFSLGPQIALSHLPRLHAKVYVADRSHAIITSGNLTHGGLSANFEYGVEISRKETVVSIRNDLALYAQLGGALSRESLQAYCRVANEVQMAFKNQLNTANASARRAFADVFRKAEDELIQIRLDRGPITTVFERTIYYLLKRDGPMPTSKLHVLIESIHPDLCDNRVYREINGRRFGRKWKHSVRTAQTHLKDRGLIILSSGVWSLRPSTSYAG
jgi:hypothetical protein